MTGYFTQNFEYNFKVFVDAQPPPQVHDRLRIPAVVLPHHLEVGFLRNTTCEEAALQSGILQWRCGPTQSGAVSEPVLVKPIPFQEGTCLL